jgi:hypothetical protein
LITRPWIGAFAVVAAILGFLWLSGSEEDRRDFVLPLGAVSVVAMVAYRLYRWAEHPFGGAASAWNGGEKDRYLKRQLAQRDRLLHLTPQMFEDAIAQLLQVRFGWSAKRTRYSGDGGWDIEIEAADGRLLVECKRYSTDKPVGRPALQKLHSAIVTERASGGILVTTSSFSEPARQFAQGTGIHLIDGGALSRLMREAFKDGVVADVTQTMCSRCGEIVTFSDTPEKKMAPCANGHPVKNHLFEVFSKAALFAKLRAARRAPT